MIKTYLAKLAQLEVACRSNFEKAAALDDDALDDEAALDKEYVQIRQDALQLLGAAKGQLSSAEFTQLKAQVVAFLCANMGCHLDVQVLESNAAEVLSAQDINDIFDNSALARWQ